MHFGRKPVNKLDSQKVYVQEHVFESFYCNQATCFATSLILKTGDLF